MTRTPSGRRSGPANALTTADLVVLSLLEERAMHGYELVGEYDRQEVADWASVSKAQVYYALKKLSERKLVAGRAEESAGARDRTVFRPTANGRAALQKALAASDWAQTRVAQPFTTWLGLSVHIDERSRARVIIARRTFLTDELARERASLDFIATLDTERARVGESIVRLVIRQIEAELEWLGTL